MPISGYKVVWPDGDESEPFDSEALEESVRRGYLLPDMMVYDPTVDQWMPASQIEILKAVYNPPTGTTGAVSGATPGGDITLTPYVEPPPNAKQRLKALLLRIPRRFYIPIAAGVCLFALIVGIAWPRKPAPPIIPSQFVATADGLYGVNVPLAWVKRNTPDKHMIEFTSDISGVTLYKVWRVPANEAEFEHVTAMVEKQTKVSLHSPGRIGDVGVVAVGGYPAHQLELNDGGRPRLSRYQVTMMETSDGVYAVTLFTPIDSMNSERNTLNSILYSFRKMSDNLASKPLNP